MLNSYEEFSSALGLKPGSDELFVGRIRGFPVGLKFVESYRGVLLLVQVRHWLPGAAPQLEAISYDDEITTLLAERKIEIDFDDGIAWVTFAEMGNYVEADVVARLLDSILQSFGKAGLIGDAELCHYCRKEKSPDLSIADGKVAQVCPSCLDERLRKTARATPAPGAEVVPIFLMTPFAALAGALLWAGCWMIYNFVLDGGTVSIPSIAIVIICFVMGMIPGAPIGWIIRLNRRRGKTASATAAILFGTLAVVAGEILYLAWLIWKWYGVFSLSVAARILPDYYGGSTGFFLVMRFMAALTCVVTAYEMAKTKKTEAKL